MVPRKYFGHTVPYAALDGRLGAITVTSFVEMESLALAQKHENSGVHDVKRRISWPLAHEKYSNGSFTKSSFCPVKTVKLTYWRSLDCIACRCSSWNGPASCAGWETTSGRRSYHKQNMGIDLNVKISVRGLFWSPRGVTLGLQLRQQLTSFFQWPSLYITYLTSQTVWQISKR